MVAVDLIVLHGGVRYSSVVCCHATVIGCDVCMQFYFPKGGVILVSYVLHKVVFMSHSMKLTTCYSFCCMASDTVSG
jgi:hypothetical protein